MYCPECKHYHAANDFKVCVSCGTGLVETPPPGSPCYLATEPAPPVITERLSLQAYSDERIAAQGPTRPENWDRLVCYGLPGEAGEVSELVKKHQFHGKPIHPSTFLLELGDVLWYLNFGAHHHQHVQGLDEVVNVVYFDEFDLGHVARMMDKDLLMDMATAHLTVDIGKIVAQLRFKEPWQAGPRELMQHMRGVFWAIAALAYVVGSNIESVAKLNNEKLRERYPHGFSVEAARAVQKIEL